MKTNKWFTGLLLLFPGFSCAEEIRFIAEPTLYFENAEGLKIALPIPKDFESFQRNWSQFEIHVPKTFFPISAPNCKETIKVRFKGIDPANATALPRQTARWDLLQQILNDSEESHSLWLKVDVTKYITKSAKGEFALQYCNVFVE